MPEPQGRQSTRLRQTARDMLWSLLVVLGIVGLVVLASWRPQPDPVRVVDPIGAVTLASMEAPFTVRVPALPDTWRATSARWEPTAKSGGVPVLFLGYVTPTGAYAQVTESAAASLAYLAEQTDRGVAGEDARVGGTSWQRWTGGDRRSLVSTGDVTTVVSGTGQWDEIEALAASLQPVAGPADVPSASG